MDDRHHQRFSSSSDRNAFNISSLLCSNFTPRKLYSISKAILGFFKKITIPVTAVSSTFLFTSFAHAESFIQRGDVGNGIFSQEAIDGRGGAIKEIANFIKDIQGAIEWIKDIKENVYQWSLDLLSFTYETLVNIVLQTPIFLFNNSFVKNTSITFSIISVSIVILLTIYEMIMKMLRKRHTDFPTIMKRFPVAVMTTGFTPFLFEQSFKFINRLTKGINQIGGATLDGDTFASLVSVGEIDTIILLLFDVTLLGLLIPIFLQQGKRWWSLFCLSAISPLALTAWVFDRHKHLFDQWWNSIKRISVVQIVYSVFIVLIGVFIYGTRFLSPEMLLIKLLIVIGSLQTLANPPQIVKSYSRGDGDVTDMYSGYKKTAQGIYNTITLKNFRPAQFIRKQKQNKLTQINNLRKQYGRRYIEDLIK